VTIKAKAVIAPDGTMQIAIVDGASREDAAALIAALMDKLAAGGVPVDDKGQIEYHRGNPDHVHAEAHVHAD
jgi:hypothetical protein